MVKISEDDYNKPEVTLTERLSEDEIKSKLKNYKRLAGVDELKDVALGTHLRYFDCINDEYKFRMGGVLINKKGIPDYVVLSNGKLTWCPQVKRCIFFKKMNNKEIKQEYKDVLEKQVKQIADLKTKARKKTVKYKDNEIDGILTHYRDLKPGEYIIAADKRRKRIYEVMMVYGIEIINDTITSIRCINKSYDKYEYDTTDYYFYITKPKKSSEIVKSLKKMTSMLKEQ